MNPFRQLKARKTKYGFTAYVHEDTIVEIGKRVAAARMIDPQVTIATNPQGGACTITIHSDDPRVEDMMKDEE